MSDLRSTILNAQDIQAESVEVPEWGVTVEVRGMTGIERAQFLQASMDEKGNVQIDRIYPEILIACTYNQEDGSKVFEPADRDMLNSKAASATERIAKVAMRLSGIDDDSKARAKNG